MLAAADGLLPSVRSLMAEQSFHKALDALWQIVGDANRYVDEQAPWTLRKTDPARMATVLYVLADTVRRLALLLQPFTPDSMAKMLDQLAVPASARSFASFDSPLKAGTTLPAPQGVFPRFVDADAST